MHIIDINLSSLTAADDYLAVLTLCQQQAVFIQTITYASEPDNSLILSIQGEQEHVTQLRAAVEQYADEKALQLDFRAADRGDRSYPKVDYYFSLMARQVKACDMLAAHQLLVDAGFAIAGISTKRVNDGDGHHAIVFFLSGSLADSERFHQQQLALSNTCQVDLVLQSFDLYHNDWRLACFDMDSTLIQVEVIDELAKAAGIGDKVSEITERAMRGELDFKQSFRERLSLLGGLSESVLEDIAKNLPYTEGVALLVAALKQRGIKTAILSGGFQYFAEHLQKKLGFDYVFANALELADGKVTGRIAGTVVDANQKALLLTRLAAQEGISPDQVLAVGDGANDLDMLNKAGMGVAFHAKPVVRETAAHNLSFLGLDAILYLMAEAP